MKVIIADDHAVVRAGLKQMLVQLDETEVVDEASDGEEALSKALENDYDVVVLDITMPKRSGLEVLKQLKVSKPDTPVLILSIHPEEQYALRMLRAGASGYLSKDSAPEELVTAVKKLASGGKYITSSLAEKLVYDLNPADDKPPHELLSNREFQVLVMIAGGKTLSDIAEELCLSIKTISTYRVRILEKLKMKSNSELTRYAIDNDLIE